MRILYALPFLILALPAAAQTLPRDADTACAATFTMLSGNARAQGLSSAALDSVARAAQTAHLRRNPREDARAYSVHVTMTAQQMRRSFTEGSLPFPQVQTQLVNCHARYDSRQMVAAVY